MSNSKHETLDETVSLILDHLFTNGSQQKGDRLLLIQEDYSGAARVENAHYLGGYSRLPVRDLLLDALRQREIEVRAEELQPHKLINFLTVLEHQVHRNHEYRPEHCAECGLTQTISSRLREQLNLTTIRRDSEAQEGAQSK